MRRQEQRFLGRHCTYNETSGNDQHSIEGMLVHRLRFDEPVGFNIDTGKRFFVGEALRMSARGGHPKRMCFFCLHALEIRLAWECKVESAKSCCQFFVPIDEAQILVCWGV